jgi:cytochrome c-type biogenesis protein CcsB
VQLLEVLLAVLRWSAVALAGVASTAYIREFSGPVQRPVPWKHGLVGGAAALMTAALVVRSVELSTVPLVTSVEALFFYAWLLLVVFLFLVRQEAHRSLGAFLVPLAAGLALLSSALMAPPGEVSSLFYNRLFALHTVSLFLGYSALSVAFCAGVMYLLLWDEIAKKRVGKMFARLPSLDDLDRLGHQTVLLGFVLLTVGIVVGMAWAKTEWDVYWVWESKSVWTLLSWLAYLGYLVTRWRYGWQGSRAAWLATVGFVLSVVTFVGTNLLSGSGRHVF